MRKSKVTIMLSPDLLNNIDIMVGENIQAGVVPVSRSGMIELLVREGMEKVEIERHSPPTIRETQGY